MGKRTSIAGAAASSAVKCTALALVLITATPAEVMEHKTSCTQCQEAAR
ncbi:hypothetical protein ABZ897_59965 [Nonomuraea sp. NPDC046802]